MVSFGDDAAEFDWFDLEVIDDDLQELRERRRARIAAVAYARRAEERAARVRRIAEFLLAAGCGAFVLSRFL